MTTTVVTLCLIELLSSCISSPLHYLTPESDDPKVLSPAGFPHSEGIVFDKGRQPRSESTPIKGETSLGSALRLPPHPPGLGGLSGTLRPHHEDGGSLTYHGPTSHASQSPKTGKTPRYGRLPCAFIKNLYDVQNSLPHRLSPHQTSFFHRNQIKTQHYATPNIQVAEGELSRTALDDVSSARDGHSSASCRFAKCSGKKVKHRSKRSIDGDYRLSTDQPSDTYFYLHDPVHLGHLKHRLGVLFHLMLSYPPYQSGGHNHLHAVHGHNIASDAQVNTDDAFKAYNNTLDKPPLPNSPNTYYNSEYTRTFKQVYKTLMNTIHSETHYDQSRPTNALERLTAGHVNQYRPRVDPVFADHRESFSLQSQTVSNSNLSDDPPKTFLNSPPVEHHVKREPFVEVKVQLSVDDVPKPQLQENMFERQQTAEAIPIQRRRVTFRRGDVVRRLYQPWHLRPLHLFSSQERSRQDKEKKEQRLYALLQLAEPLGRLEETGSPYDCTAARDMEQPSTMRCQSDVNICVPHVMLCDGIQDCPQGEDETTSFCLQRARI